MKVEYAGMGASSNGALRGRAPLSRTKALTPAHQHCCLSIAARGEGASHAQPRTRASMSANSAQASYRVLRGPPVESCKACVGVAAAVAHGGVDPAKGRGQGMAPCLRCCDRGCAARLPE